MRHVDPARRGAAFGSILAAFDTGIGTGSVVIGCIVQHYGYQPAYAAAALLAALALPYFLTVEPGCCRPTRRCMPSGLHRLNQYHLPGGASRLASWLVAHIWPICSLLAPCDPGAALRQSALTSVGTGHEICGA